MITRFMPVLAAVIASAAMLPATDNIPVRQVGIIPLPGVEGHIDHLAVDVRGKRLFVSALGNNTLEVLDLRNNKRITAIAGLSEPQGVFYVPGADKLYVANAHDATCRIFDGATFKLLRTVSYSSDADNVRYDAANKQIYIGYGEGALGVIDVNSGEEIATIPLAGHPESFRLELSGPRIYVNVPSAHHTIAVVDRVKRVVVATWQLEAEANFPMALDEQDRRLLIVSRQPPRLIVLDTRSGKTLASVAAVEDADDLFFDSGRKRAYVSGGAGYLDVFEQHGPDQYQRILQIPTASGARTSLFVPELNRLYLAVPHRGNQGAEIRIYDVQP